MAPCTNAVLPQLKETKTAATAFLNDREFIMISYLMDLKTGLLSETLINVKEALAQVFEQNVELTDEHHIH